MTLTNPPWKPDRLDFSANGVRAHGAAGSFFNGVRRHFGYDLYASFHNISFFA